MGPTSELCRLSATEAVALLRRREISPVEAVEAAAARIAEVEPHINALPTLCIDRARERAARIMVEKREPDNACGWLAGLPIAVKDLNPVAGVRTTYGSRVYASHVPDRSDRLVERLEANGAIVIAKSNTPEFGAGASTFNEVFGKTRNPWNTEKSVAGSSGGSAAALASGEVWLATGSDLGGSLRTPASFNAVVGLRPSPGRVVRGATRLAFDALFVEGPMARTVADTALFLDAMVGADPADPLALEAPAELFAHRLAMPDSLRRVAYSPNLGITPVDAEVAEICAAAALRLARTGVEVVDESPDFAGSFDIFRVLRGVWFAAQHAQHLHDHAGLLRPEVVAEVERGLAFSAADIARAELARTELCARVAAFFARHDLLLCPTAIVPPFDIDRHYVDELNGERYENYVQWTSITSAITLTGCPALSLPAGFTQSGLPVGIQIVGPPRQEALVLAAAARLEAALDLARLLPVDPVRQSPVPPPAPERQSLRGS